MFYALRLLCINFSDHQGNIKQHTKYEMCQMKNPAICVRCAEDTTAHRSEDSFYWMSWAEDRAMQAWHC